MFIKNWETEIVEGTPAVERDCELCNTFCENFIITHYYGPSIGLIFMKKPLLSMKKYYFICSTCKRANMELTKEQVNAYKKEL